MQMNYKTVVVLSIMWLMMVACVGNNPAVHNGLDQAKLNVTTYTKYLQEINTSLIELQATVTDPEAKTMVNNGNRLLVELAVALMDYTSIVKIWESTQVMPVTITEKEKLITDVISTLTKILTDINRIENRVIEVTP